jgi:broad specificity phosphatase PhoE
MTVRLVLVRHGPSAHPHRGTLDRAGLQQWRDAYDGAGISAGVRPPESLIELAAGAGHVVASDLPRAVESAQRLAPHREIRVSALLREAPLAIPRWPTRLPLLAWEALIHTRWSLQRIRGTDAAGPDWVRAATAARWLTEIVADGTMAVVVTHGVFRRLVAMQLAGLGWVSSRREGGYRHWSCWSFRG